MNWNERYYPERSNPEPIGPDDGKKLFRYKLSCFMPLNRMRPTFDVNLAYSKGELIRCIELELQKPNWIGTSLFFVDYVELHLPKSEIRYWSPHLSLSFDGDETHTCVHGRFAPRQEVWTFVWVIYLALAFTAFFASVFTFAFWMIGQSTWFGLTAILSVIGIGLLYLTSQIGQFLSADQMTALKSDWMRLIEQACPPAPPFCNDSYQERSN